MGPPPCETPWVVGGGGQPPASWVGVNPPARLTCAPNALEPLLRFAISQSQSQIPSPPHTSWAGASKKSGHCLPPWVCLAPRRMMCAGGRMPAWVADLFCLDRAGLRVPGRVHREPAVICPNPKPKPSVLRSEPLPGLGVVRASAAIRQTTARNRS